MNSRPQNYHRSRCVPSNSCAYCGKLWGNFNPVQGMILRDRVANNILGWVCKDGCEEFENYDDDDSIEIG